jgi:hypothetical protein
MPSLFGELPNLALNTHSGKTDLVIIAMHALTDMVDRLLTSSTLSYLNSVSMRGNRAGGKEGKKTRYLAIDFRILMPIAQACTSGF